MAEAGSYFVQLYRRNQGDPKLSAWYLKIILDAHDVRRAWRLRKLGGLQARRGGVRR